MEREVKDWLARESRKGVSLVGSARWPDGTAARVLISNISYEGCELWCDRDFAKGETFTLALGSRGEVEAQVRWASDGRAGVRLLVGKSAADDRRARLGV